MRATVLLLLLFLAATAATAELSPWSAVGSKEEASRAFAGVERALQLKVRGLAVLQRPACWYRRGAYMCGASSPTSRRSGLGPA